MEKYELSLEIELFECTLIKAECLRAIKLVKKKKFDASR